MNTILETITKQLQEWYPTYKIANHNTHIEINHNHHTTAIIIDANTLTTHTININKNRTINHNTTQIDLTNPKSIQQLKTTLK